MDALPVADCGGADGMCSTVDAAELCGFDIISVCDNQSGSCGADREYAPPFVHSHEIHYSLRCVCSPGTVRLTTC